MMSYFVQLEADKLVKLYRDDSVEKLADEIRQIRVCRVFITKYIQIDVELD